FRSRVRRDVVHQRNAFVEEVAPASVDLTTRSIIRNAAPFKARDELSGDCVEALEQMRERRVRRLLHRQRFQPNPVYIEMRAMTFNRGVRHEVVDVGVVLEGGSVMLATVVVHQTAERPKG